MSTQGYPDTATKAPPTQLSLFDHPLTHARNRTRTHSPQPDPPAPTPAPSHRPSINPTTSLNTAVNAYIEHLQHRVQAKDLAESSFGAMRCDIENVGRIIGLHRPLSDLGRRDFHQKLIHALRQQYSDATVARRVATANGFISWLADQNAAHLPSIPSPKVDEGLPTILHDGQVRQLLETTASADDPQTAFLVRLLLSTGIKRYEAMNLRVQDMRLNAAPPFVTIRGKGRKHRNIYVPTELRAYYDAYCEAYNPIDKIFTVVIRTLEDRLESLSDDLNAPISFSSLRWTSAYRDLRRGMDHERIRRKLALSPATWDDTLERLQRLGV